MSELPPKPSTPGRFSPSPLMILPMTTEFAITKPLATPGTRLMSAGLVHGFWHFPGLWMTGETYRLPSRLTRRQVAVCDVYQSIEWSGDPISIGLIVRLDIWLGRIARPPFLMSRAPLITTSHGLAPRPETLVPLATCAWMTLFVVAVAGVIDGSPYVPGRKKNWRRWLPEDALRAALIEATDIDGSKIVTFAPNGFDGTVATGAGVVVHGGLAAAEADETPPRRKTLATDTIASSLHGNRSARSTMVSPPALTMQRTPIAPPACP